MELTYIFHSGFTIETERCILVFDYWMDPADVMSCILTAQKPIYVFSSHSHPDHFTRKIFAWKEKKDNITYILSKDIQKHKRAQKEEADVWLAKGGTWEDENIKVIATGSNDSGVSWIVETCGKRIFHAGDLCNWYARFLAEENVPETVESEEFGRINPKAEEKMFLGELKDIERVLKTLPPRPLERGLGGEADSFDLVMFPVDGRVGNGYTLGARQFIERFNVGMFVPMHFVMSGFESSWRMEPFCQEKNIPFWCIQKEGESISLFDGIYIRQSRIDDIPTLQNIFAIARKFMTDTGNPYQWTEDYPSDDLLKEDITSGDSYVIVRENKIIATFVLRGGIDPTYNVIYDGAWLNDLPYATIHRIASNGEMKGIFGLAMQFALQHYESIRIDTHADNKVMQHTILKSGFKYCGIIHCWNGSERLAYQYNKQ